MDAKPVRILLVYPPSGTQRHLSCPPGMLMLAAVLEKARCEVHLLDANAACRPCSVEEVVGRAALIRPDVIGMTLVTPLVREAYRLAAKLRPLGAKLTAGGPHATVLPEEAVAHGFDAAVVGEGEATVEEAVQALLGRMPREAVKGWVYRDGNGRAIRTEPRPLIENLDHLPLPARHLVNFSDYGPEQHPSQHVNLFSSRGCPAKCAFCAGELFGKQFRFRSARNVLEEMAHLHRTYGTRHFHFVDDAMTMNRQRIQEFCDLLLESGLPVTWSIMTRIDSVSESMLRMVARAGCIQIDYGVESGHAETLKRIRKSHTVQMVKHVVPLTAVLGIKPYVFFILGFPWDTAESIRATQDLMIELSPYVERFHPAIASILIPFPGTGIYEQYKEQHHLEDWWLDPARSYDAPRLGRHSYWESVLFSRGAVLDANFFDYRAEVKQRIYGVFKFMYLHNLRSMGRCSRLVRRTLFECSRRLAGMSPAWERRLSATMVQVLGWFRRVRGYRLVPVPAAKTKSS